MTLHVIHYSTKFAFTSLKSAAYKGRRLSIPPPRMRLLGCWGLGFNIYLRIKTPFNIMWPLPSVENLLLVLLSSIFRVSKVKKSGVVWGAALLYERVVLWRRWPGQDSGNGWRRRQRQF